MTTTIRWRLVLSSFIAIALPLACFAWFVSSILWDFYVGLLREDLSQRAQMITVAVVPALSSKDPAGMERLRTMVDAWTAQSPVRVTIADSEGVVAAATNQKEVGLAVDTARKPGLLEALRGEQNSQVWKSPNFDFEDTMYVNMPVRQETRVVGAVRVGYSLSEIQRRVGRIRNNLLSLVGAYGLLVILLSTWVSGSIVKPVERLNRSAAIIAAGDLDHRITPSGSWEIRQLAGTLNQMTDRLQRLENLRRRNVSDVSHELRTPLAAIRGLAETVIQHGDSDPALRGKYLPRIIEHTDRLARLATQLLDLSQIESGNLVESASPFSLPELLKEVFRLCGEEAAKKGVTLTSEAGRDLPPVLGDRDRLLQVFVNLVENAVRHTPGGGQVKIETKAIGTELVIEVSDTGVGISPEHLPYIFDRFYRVQASRPRDGGGTGLGLAIVRQILEAHGGRIFARSEPGVGTVFTLHLPLQGPPARAGMGVTKGSIPQGDSSGHGQVHPGTSHPDHRG